MNERRVTLADIAKQAGVATRTLYQHFGDKEAIFREVVYARDAAGIARPDRVAVAHGKPAARLLCEPGGVIVGVTQSLDEFVQARGEWNRLAGRQQNPLLWHEWFLSAALTLHELNDVRIVMRREGGRLVSGVPLAMNRQGAVERLEFLGSRALGEPSGFVFADECALARGLQEACAMGTPLILSRISADSPARPVLGQALGRGVLLGGERSPIALAAPREGLGDLLAVSRSTSPLRPVSCPPARGGGGHGQRGGHLPAIPARDNASGAVHGR